MTSNERPGADHIARIVAKAPTFSEVGKAKLAVLLWPGLRDREGLQVVEKQAAKSRRAA